MPSIPSAVSIAIKNKGWSEVRYDCYKRKSGLYISYLFIHPSGQWVRGEGLTHSKALQAVHDAIQKVRPTTPRILCLENQVECYERLLNIILDKLSYFTIFDGDLEVWKKIFDSIKEGESL